MAAIHRQRDWMNPDPEPAVPTADELRLADQIRRQLEVRLLRPVEGSTSLRYEWDWADRDAA